MSSKSVERRLVAILSADVAGYSKLIAADDVGTVRTLTAYREEMQVLASQHGGRVVDSPGDNILMEFSSATDAVEAALAMQRVIAARNVSLPADKQLEFRMGVHLGEVLVEGDRIYGDGVNIAARIEAVADPGGVSVSEPVRAQVANKVDFDFVDLGEFVLKNIADPVRVFEAAEQAVSRSIAPSGRDQSEDGHAVWIAVLPFDNMSGDSDQDYFADGLTEDIITGLSAFRHLRVIARTASFRYRDSDSSIVEIAGELGVRFVVEGSVRRAGTRVRVNAQLIDGNGGHHIWAEKYDADVDDMFEAQDRITESIVAAVDPAIAASESERLARVRPDSIDAWGHVQRGWSEFWRYRPDTNKEAQKHFQAAIDLDPSYAEAHSGLAIAHTFDAFLFWVDDIPGSMDLAYEAAKRAVELDGRDAMGFAVLAFISWTLGRLDTAVQQGERAVELNPNNAIAQIIAGVTKTYNGDPGGGLVHTERAIALAPNDPTANWFWGLRALANLLLGEPEEAVAAARTAIKIRHGYLFGRSMLTAALVDLGRLNEAQEEMARILEIEPEFSVSRFDQYQFKEERDRQHILGNLKAAGLPE